MNFSNYLEHIIGVSIYPVISLVLFLVFFSGVIIHVYRMDQQELAHMEQLPLSDDLTEEI